MSQAYKRCPICGTPANAKALVCGTCGTSLAEVMPIGNGHAPRRSPKRTQNGAYDRRYGETDMHEGELGRSRIVAVLSGLVVLVLIGCAAVLVLQGARSFAALLPTPLTPTPSMTPVATLGGVAVTPTRPLLFITNTPMTAPRLATVTPMPPTVTLTPTQGPCEIRVPAGADLISLAMQCGHRSLDVIPDILELNNLSAPESIQAGQVLLIPLPTPTLDPNASTEADAPPGTAIADANVPLEAANPDSMAIAMSAAVTSTETLLDGMMWHTIQPDESMVGIAYLYRTSAEVLSDMNPEITFSQCDYSLDTGGPRCTVLLQAGQRMRVPAPPLTPTLSPTPSGSETATPTLTATFNAPTLLSPSPRALFQPGELITLRWVASGALAPGEAYLVRVTDLTTGVAYTERTTQLYFIVPTAWQATDGGRHDYEWTISVARAGTMTAQYTTEERPFTWVGRGE